MKTGRLILFFSLIMFFSCEEEGFIVDCSECITEEPTDASLEMKIDENDSPVIIEIYSGILQDSILFRTIETNRSQLVVSVPLNNMYTVTAKYNRDGKTYIAIDTAYPRVRFEEDQCDDPCYFIYNKNLNLKLKYTD